MTKLYFDREKHQVSVEVKAYLSKKNIYATKKQTNHIVEVIHQCLCFNKSLTWKSDTQNLSLVTTAKDLMEIYKLRSKIYQKLNYEKEFPDTIMGLNYDTFDTHSAILFTKNNEKITGTCRIIFDSDEKLPIDKYFSLDYLRKEEKRLAELSRLMIDRETKALAQEPKLLTMGTYKLLKQNDMTTLVSVMVEEHFRYYQKFGGFSIEEKMQTYGSLQTPFIITKWEIHEITPFFKRLFLS